MIEPYQWLWTHADTLGIQREHIGPASADLCLSGEIKQYTKLLMHTWKLEAHTPFIFEPGCFYLCSTCEYIKVPTTHAGQTLLRSSLARKGLSQGYAGYIDPGFEGQITLELEATIPVRVTIGERIVQLIYHRLTEATVRPYQGHYQGQRGPTEAYGSQERPLNEKGT